MSKMDTIEILSILGGAGAALSPIFLFFGIRNFPIWGISSYYLGEVSLFLFVLSFLTGLLGCVIAVRSSGFVSKMPQRAAGDLKGTGVMIIIVGFITLLNIGSIVSGMLILVAGIKCGATWKRIQRARHRTGWPFTTVATATGNMWARRLSCRFCGAPLIARTAMSTGHSVKVKTLCPLDKTTEVINLPLSQLESWVPKIADRFHRCERCGDRTAALLVIRQNGRVSRLKAFCPNGHPNRKYRTIWTPLYPHVMHTPAVDVGFQGAQVRPQLQPAIGVGGHMSMGVASAGTYPRVTPQAAPVTQPIPLSSRSSPSRRVGSIQFCSNCGVKIEAFDTFCYRCGSQIY